MSPTEVTLAAWGLLVLTHWANNQPAVSGTEVIEMTFALVLIALLEGTAARPVAAGLAWLLLAAVLLGNNSILTAVAKRKA